VSIEAPEAPAVVSLDDVLPDKPEIAAPPKRELPSEVPADKSDPGYTPRSRRGRPPKDQRARTTNVDPKDVKKAREAAKLEPKDFTGDLAAITDAVWLAGSQIAPVSPYAAILKANQAGLVSALNQAANQNGTVRNYVEKLSGGGNGSWMMSLSMVGVSMAMQSMQMARDPELRQQIVTANAEAAQNYFQQIAGSAQAQAA
jgi:hypothetical protein